LRYILLIFIFLFSGCAISDCFCNTQTKNYNNCKYQNQKFVKYICDSDGMCIQNEIGE